MSGARKRKAPSARAPSDGGITFIAAGEYGQVQVEDAPGFKAVKLRRLKHGIWRAQLSEAGRVTAVTIACELDFPIGWLAYNATNGFLYASDTANERLVSLAVRDDGTVAGKVVGSCDSLGGAAYVELSRDGKWALTANYGSGAIAVFPLGADGSIGLPTDSKQPWPLDAFTDETLHDRQEGPHPHQIRLDPLYGRWALACDLGSDRVYVYDFDAHRGALSGAVSSARHLTLPAGSGPRHLDFDPDLRSGLVYILCELAGSVVVCMWEAANGTLSAVQTLSLMPSDLACSRAHHSGCCHIVAGRSAVYATCRTDNTIVVLQKASTNGVGRHGRGGPLRVSQRVRTGGHCSRHFRLDEVNRLLHVSHQDSQDVRSYRVGDDGMLDDAAVDVVSTAGMCPVVVCHTSSRNV